MEVDTLEECGLTADDRKSSCSLVSSWYAPLPDLAFQIVDAVRNRRSDLLVSPKAMDCNGTQPNEGFPTLPRLVWSECRSHHTAPAFSVQASKSWTSDLHLSTVHPTHNLAATHRRRTRASWRTLPAPRTSSPSPPAARWTRSPRNARTSCFPRGWCTLAHAPRSAGFTMSRPCLESCRAACSSR
jgi:hypothetical protein